MKQYISKSALVAEIKRKIRTEQGYSSGDAECGYQDCAREILSFIDTLEVKEADLEDEIEKVKKMQRNVELKNDTIIEFCAKHFFELGLKAKG